MNHDELFLTVRRLFTADDTKLDTESLLLVIRLLVQKADEQQVFLSHDTLATQLRCSVSTIEKKREATQATWHPCDQIWQAQQLAKSGHCASQQTAPG